MELTDDQVRDLEMLLGTLDTCDYLQVTPRLTEENWHKLVQMRAIVARYLYPLEG